MLIHYFRFAIVLLVLSPLSSTANEKNSTYEAALIAFNESKFDLAYVLTKNTIQETPKYLPARILMGKLLLNKKEFTAAEQEFSEAEFAGADLNLFSKEWGQALLASRQFTRLISLQFESLLSEQNQLTWTYLKAEACINADDYSCARKLLNELRNNKSQRVNALNSLARMSLQEGEYADAKKLLDEAVAYNAADTESLRLLGLYHRNVGDLLKAQMFLEQAYDVDSSSPMISRNLTDIYISQGKLQPALTLSEKILNEYPQDPYVNFAFTWLKQHLGKKKGDDKAFKQLEVSLSKLSNQTLSIEPTLIYLRGLVNYVQGSFELALQDFDAYVSGHKSNTDAAFLLSKTHLALNDPAAALSVFSKYETAALQNFQHAVFLGNLYLERNKVYKANMLLDHLKSNYEEHPKTAQFELKIQLAKTDKSLAFDTLERMYTNFPEDIEVLQIYVLTNLEFSRFDYVEKGIDTLSSIDPGNHLIANFKIASNIKQGTYNSALQIIDREIKQQGESFDLLFNKAVSLNGMKRYKNAVPILESLLQRRGKHLAANLALAKSYIGAGVYDKATSLYRKLLDNYEDSAVVRSEYIEYLISLGDLNQALNQTTLLTRQFPSSASYIILKARLHIKLTQFDKAKVETKKLSYLAEANPLLLKAQSSLYSALGEYGLALNAMENLRKILPNQRQIEVDYIRVLLQNRAFVLAAKMVEHLLQTYPNDSEVGLLNADLVLLQGDTSSANEQYKKLLVDEPNNQVVLAKMYSLVSKGVNAEAFLAALDAAINIDDSYFYRSLRAQYHYYYGNKDTAIIEYEYILTNNLMPNKSALLNRLAGLYLPDNLVMSEKYILQAYELDKGNAKVLQTYGWLKALKGNFSDALGLLREASAMDNSSKTLKYRLAYTLDKLGRKSEASTLLKDILSFDNIHFDDKNNAILLLHSIENTVGI